MYKLLLTITIFMFSIFAKGQNKLDEQFAKANSTIRYNQLLNRILWDLRPVNGYDLDQDKGTIRYQTDNPEVYAIVKPAILGTFNLADKTFLWADKNISVEKNLADNVEKFRSELPKKYQSNKFTSDVKFNEKLLALFSTKLQANGCDSKRQDQTILYFAFMHIDVYENNKIKYSLEPESHFEFIENDAAIALVKQLHREMVAINDKYNNKKELTTKEAFKALTDVHLHYWLNEDQYYFPSLSWPCRYDEKITSDFKVIRYPEFDRTFVVYTSDLGWTMEHYAYEIDTKAKGNKIIIGSY